MGHHPALRLPQFCQFPAGHRPCCDGFSSAIPMNLENERQHYISKVLLKRFKIPNAPLQCYKIDTQTWEAKSVDRLCAEEGYNQLLVSGQETNNALEAIISRVESL